MPATLPENISSVDELEDLLSRPNEGVVDTFRRLEGDVIVLGVAGKMGPTLSRMIKRASDAAGRKRKVIGVSRFSSPDQEKSLNAYGIETIRCDLLDGGQLAKLPDAPNVVYMAGFKFGSDGQEGLTWAMNSYLPGMVCQKYPKSKIVAFSTGNIYGLVPIKSGGAKEGDELNPLGDYAMSCLGRERIFDHFSRTLKIPLSLIRLNYSTELRYGVLHDLAQQIQRGDPIDLSTGSVNVIWQTDANAMALQAFNHVSTPPFVLNVSGPELLSVRRVSEELARCLNKDVKFVGSESENALLNNGQLGHRLYGYPQVSVQQAIRWTADWVKRGGAGLGKPTHFETRNGKF